MSALMMVTMIDAVVIVMMIGAIMMVVVVAVVVLVMCAIMMVMMGARVHACIMGFCFGLRRFRNIHTYVGGMMTMMMMMIRLRRRECNGLDEDGARVYTHTLYTCVCVSFLLGFCCTCASSDHAYHLRGSIGYIARNCLFFQLAVFFIHVGCVALQEGVHPWG